MNLKCINVFQQCYVIARRKCRFQRLHGMLQVTCAILQPEHSPASDSCQTQGMVEIQQEQGGSL